MKQIKIYLALAIGALLFNSCSGFLDSEPLTLLTDVNFYKTKADAELAIVGCYDGVQQIGGVGFPVLSEVLSDNCFSGTGNNDALNYLVLDEFDLSKSPGEVDILNANWESYYKAIYRMNVLLQKMDQIDWNGDDAYRNNIEAQARFLRANCYFEMVRIWERVPLLTEPSSGNIPQSEPDEIYKAITEDLLYAAENGTETVEPGRINKFAAKAMLAKVFLFYTGFYQKTDLVGLVTKATALQGLEDVIGSTKYGLVEEYKNLWPAASTYIEGDTLATTFAGKDNSETVFSIKYNITSNWNGNTDGNQWLVMLGMRAQTASPYGKGWGGCTVLPSLYNEFEAEDLRKTASIISFADENIEFDNTDTREVTGYINKKYIPLANPSGSDVSESAGGVSFMISQYQDFVGIRYADVLLMAAELGSTNAQTYFDLVRERAGLTSITATLANILEERRFEFAFEGIRYWDLIRQGIEVAAPKIEINTKVLNGGVETDKIISSSNIIAKRGFQMIPQQQITRSGGVLTQNAGWQ